MSDKENGGLLGMIMLLLVAVVSGFAIFALLVLFGAFAQGYVLSKLWAWFIAPKFGLPLLGVAEAFALMLTVKLVTGKAFESCKDKDEKKLEDGEKMAKIGKDMFNFLLVCGLTLLMGWILHNYFVTYPELPT